MKSSTLTLPSRPVADDRVRPETRAALLSALEHAPPLTRRALEALTSLSPVTLRHACEALCREGILVRTPGHDPESGHACDLLAPVRAPILPLIELTDTHLRWWLFDTWCEPVTAILRKRSAMHTLEDDVEYLFCRVKALYAGAEALTTAPTPCSPVLLCSSDAPEDVHADALIRRIWGASLLAVSPAEAVGAELALHPVTREDTCLLHLQMGVKAAATLLVRSDMESPFLPSPHTADLSAALAAYVGDALPLSSLHTAGLAAFLADLGRFVSLDRVVLELPDRTDGAVLGAVEAACTLGDQPPPVCPLFLGSPSLSHRGAIRLLRRAMWGAHGEIFSNN